MKELSQMTKEEKEELLRVVSNPVFMDDSRAMGHPVATISMIAVMDDAECLKSCLPTISEWEERGEKVTMQRVLKLLAELYDVDSLLQEVQDKA